MQAIEFNKRSLRGSISNRLSVWEIRYATAISEAGENQKNTFLGCSVL
jgi:hypothetical protein